MKKKKLKNLNVNKSTISSLNQQNILGGDIIIFITIRRTCPIPFPHATNTTCSQFEICDSIKVCSIACKTDTTNTDVTTAG